MKKILTAIIILNGLSACAGSMFDNNGNYSGNWKPMTNYSSSSSYSSSSYSTTNWNNRNTKSRAATQVQNSAKMYTEPFRYNTLDYKRVRRLQDGSGDYSAKCSDIGDTSFCQ